MKLINRGVLAAMALLAALGLGSLASCAAEPEIVAEGAIIVDVRTPQEFAQGHLEGAINIDYTAADFASNIAGLDHGARYVLYCRSGNRSGKSLELMQQAGFTDLQNAGGLSDASRRLGLDIIQ